MKRILSVLLFAIAGSQCWLHGVTAQASKGEDQKKQLTFVNVMMGETVDEAGSKLGFKTVGRSQAILSFTTFLGSDGIHLTARSAEFSSVSEAKRYFDYTLSSASNVLLHAHPDNPRSVDDRAEIVQSGQPGDAKSYAVVWESGVYFHEITSKSLEDCLQLEHRYEH